MEEQIKSIDKNNKKGKRKSVISSDTARWPEDKEAIKYKNEGAEVAKMGKIAENLAVEAPFPRK
jgi:hypothetical protein